MVAGAITGVSCSPQLAKPLLTEKNATATVLVAGDTSSSARTTLPTRTEELGRLSSCLDPDQTWITVYRFDNQVRECFSTPLPDSDEALLSQMAKDFAPPIGKVNTYLNLLIPVLVKRAGVCNGPCILLISTDGYGEGMDTRAHGVVRQAATELARNKHLVAVLVEGVEPTNMAQMRADLEPLAGKLRFIPLGGLDASLVSDLLSSGGVH